MVTHGAELIRQAFEAINQRDLEEARALADDDADFYPIRSQLEGTTYRGPDGFADAISAAWEDWDELRFDVEEIRELSDGLVAFVRFQARGSSSGVDLDVPTGWHIRVGGDKLVYARAYSKPEEALRAAGST